jgi:hypothetical protein
LRTKLNSRIPLGHFLVRTLLLQTPRTARAIAELETAPATTEPPK